MTGQQLKNSILQLAIQGKLVAQDPNDEPASELLKRIRKEKEALVKEGKLKKKDLVSTPIADDEKPFEIPKGWEWCRLGEISTYAQTKKKINAKNAAPNMWGLDLEDIEKGGRLLCKKTVGERRAIGDKTCFVKGQILYSKLRPYLLKVLIAPDNGICTSEIVPFGCYADICHFYIRYILLSSYVDCYINAASFGIKMPRVGTETMTNLLIPLPPLTEQHRVVEKIEQLLPLVEKFGKAQEELNALNKSLPESLKKSILQEAIMGRLVPQDPNEEPASVLLSRIRKEKEALVKEGKLKKKDLVSTPIADEEKPFEIPKTWEWCRLGEILYTNTGLSYAKENLSIKENNMVRVLRGGNILFGEWKKQVDDVMISSRFVKEELLLRAGTFITPAVTSLENMGKTALIEKDCNDTVVGGFVLMLLPFYRNSTFLKYLLCFFNGGYYKECCKKITNKSGQAFYNLSRKRMLEIPIPLPPLAEQHRIVTKLEEILPKLKEIQG